MSGDSVIVVVRVRPLNNRETTMKSGQCVELLPEDRLTITDGSAQPRPFAFDAVFNPQTTQEEVFERTGALVLEKALEGYNVTMFAYGQTGEMHERAVLPPWGVTELLTNRMCFLFAGSGKTYTMEGTPEDPGVIHRVCYDLFRRISERADRCVSCGHNCC